MSNRRSYIAHGLAGLAYGWLGQAITWLFLLRAYHGQSTPGGPWIFWFEFFGRRVEPSIVFTWVPIAFTVVPLLAAFWVARRLPFAELRQPAALTIHALIAMLSLVVNAVLILFAEIQGYDRNSF